jgi:hypothetical protein
MHTTGAMPYHTLALVQQLLGNGFKSWIVGNSYGGMDRLPIMYESPVIGSERSIRRNGECASGRCNFKIV